jgi:hypothetical protein
LAAFLGLAVLSAGCGSSGGDTTVTLTKAQFVKQGDAICKKGYEEKSASLAPFVKDPQKYAELTRPEEEKLVLKLVLPSYKKEAKELRELAPPEGEEQTIDAMITELEDTVKRVEEDPGSILNGAHKQFAKVEAMTNDYGFEYCGDS